MHGHGHGQVVVEVAVVHAGLLGISVSASGAGQNDVIGNRATANPVGIHLGPDTDDVVVDGNTALQKRSTARTAPAPAAPARQAPRTAGSTTSA